MRGWLILEKINKKENYMALLDIYNLAVSGGEGLKERVGGACLKAAYDIVNEDPVTANHANRMIWAQEVLQNFMTKANQMYLTVLANATIQASGTNSTDNDIQFVVNSLINQFATGA